VLHINNAGSLEKQDISLFTIPLGQTEIQTFVTHPVRFRTGIPQTCGPQRTVK